MTQNSAHTGKLYVVGTPIGNLGDLSPRVGEAFASADAICCEDTRVTSKLLMHLGISKPLVRCDENVIASRAVGLVDRLLSGRPSPLPRMPACRVCPIPARRWSRRRARPMCPLRLFPGPLLALRRSFRPAFLASIFLRRLFGSQAWRPRASSAASRRGARRAHLLRVSTSHRGNARGRGGGLSPA